MLRIFTDTAANIPPHLLEQYHITAMPLTYLLDGQPTELVGHDYYEAMRKGAEVKTSLVSPALIRDTMESALKDGDDVLYIAISGGISGTCWSAELMAEELRGEYPDRMIRVLNTCGASLGEGLVVLEAAKMLEKGCTADEIIRQAEENCGRMRQFFMVDDLKYLRRGGRISAAAQVAGSLLKIKPILQSDPEGHIIQHSKVRGQLKAMETLAELYKEYAVDGTRWASPMPTVRTGRCGCRLSCGMPVRPVRSCRYAMSRSPVAMWAPARWRCSSSARSGAKAGFSAPERLHPAQLLV